MCLHKERKSGGMHHRRRHFIIWLSRWYHWYSAASLLAGESTQTWSPVCIQTKSCPSNWVNRGIAKVTATTSIYLSIYLLVDLFSFQYSPCLKSLFLIILYWKGNVLLQEPSTVALADVFGSQQRTDTVLSWGGDGGSCLMLLCCKDKCHRGSLLFNALYVTLLRFFVVCELVISVTILCLCSCSVLAPFFLKKNWVFCSCVSCVFTHPAFPPRTTLMCSTCAS